MLSLGKADSPGFREGGKGGVSAGFFCVHKKQTLAPEIKLLKLIPNQQVLGGFFRLVINVFFIQ